MFNAAILLTVLLQFSTSIIAAPASNPAVGLTQTSPSISDIELETLLNEDWPEPSKNGTGTSFPVDGTSITLTIKPIPNQKILRNDLVVALYDSREYLRGQKRVSWLSDKDEPFSSHNIPNPPNVKCEIKAKSQAPNHLTYRYMAEVVQGLMDYTFFPYTPSVDSVTFEISHKLWGALGSGSMTADGPAVSSVATS